MATVREATFDDYEPIEALKERHNLFGYTEARWRRIYERSPLLRRQERPWPIGWVIENDDHDIVGHLGNTPLEYLWNGQPLTCAAASLWVVDERYRGQSLALVRRYLRQPGIDLFLDTTATQVAARVFEKLGMKRTPAPAYDRASYWVLDHEPFVASFLNWKHFQTARNLARPLAGMMAVAEKIAGKSRLRADATVPVEFCEHFDERFDRFWETLRARRPGLVCVRNRENLSWRFQEAVNNGVAWILIAGDKTAPLAYAVCLRQDSPDIGLKRMRLADFQCVEGLSKLLPAILSAALARCRDEGIHMFEAIGFGAETKARIEALAPHRRQLPSWMFLYKAQDAALAGKLENPSVWDPCTYDGDGWLAQITS